jgi:glycerol-3-phosphate dehydrogenase
VRPLAFLLPVYEGDPRPLWLMRLGMTLYDLLALFRNTAPHRALAPEAALAQEPNLARAGLRGAIRFFDCQEDDARFCIDNILHAAQLGATCANYCEVTGFAIKGEKIAAAHLTDRVGGAEFEIRARAFVNAAGPWIDRVARLLPTGGGAVTVPALSPAKGVHLLLPRLTRSHGIFFQARLDGRMMFILPWNDCTMVGTTDTDFRGDPADVHADAADAGYLLESARSIFPEQRIDECDIITSFAGIRPLLRSDASNPSARSREHQVLQQADNLLSIAGGKYTTYRLIAKQVVDRVYEVLGARAPRCTTGRTLIPDFRASPGGDRIADAPRIFASDILKAVRDEMATSVDDVMRRRTGLALSRSGTPDIAGRVSQIMSSELAWTEIQREASVDAYRTEWERNLVRITHVQREAQPIPVEQNK